MFVLRYATDLIPIWRVIRVPCVFRDFGIVSAPEPDISAMFKHSFTDGSTRFADVDLVTYRAWNPINNTVTSVTKKTYVRQALRGR